MRKMSVLKPTSIYKMSRLKAGVTLLDAIYKLGLSQEKQLRRIEMGEARAQPEVVLLMSDAYDDPLLPFKHCKFECAIGQQFHHEYEPRSLTASVIQLNNAIERAQRIKKRLLEIAEDERITEDEIPDLIQIMQMLLPLEHKIGEFKLSITSAVNLRDIMKKHDHAGKQIVV